MVEELHDIEAYSPEHGFLDEVMNYSKTRTKYTKNEIRVYENGVCEIDVYDSFGNYKNTSTFSLEDLELVKAHKWYVDSVGYLTTTIGKEKIRFHRMLFPDIMTDHYDNNKLNNTRENLRPTTPSVNTAKIPHKSQNKHGVTGIVHTKNGTWGASIERNKKKQSRYFKTKEEAVLCRYIWELNYLGDNAPQLDKIEKEYPMLTRAMRDGIRITDNIALAKNIISRLNKDAHCPCRLEKNKDTKCMCKEFREQDSGMCGCGLYIKMNEE